MAPGPQRILNNSRPLSNSTFFLLNQKYLDIVIIVYFVNQKKHVGTLVYNIPVLYKIKYKDLQ